MKGNTRLLMIAAASMMSASAIQPAQYNQTLRHHNENWTKLNKGKLSKKHRRKP